MQTSDDNQIIIILLLGYFLFIYLNYLSFTTSCAYMEGYVNSIPGNTK